MCLPSFALLLLRTQEGIWQRDRRDIFPSAATERVPMTGGRSVPCVGCVVSDTWEGRRWWLLTLAGQQCRPREGHRRTGHVTCAQSGCQVAAPGHEANHASSDSDVNTPRSKQQWWPGQSFMRHSFDVSTRALLRSGELYILCVCGGGEGVVPLRWIPNYLTDLISKFKTPFDSSAREISETILSGSLWWPRRAGQTSNVRLFGVGEISEQNICLKRKQSQWVGMFSVSNILKYYFQ